MDLRLKNQIWYGFLGANSTMPLQLRAAEGLLTETRHFCQLLGARHFCQRLGAGGGLTETRHFCQRLGAGGGRGGGEGLLTETGHKSHGRARGSRQGCSQKPVTFVNAWGPRGPWKGCSQKPVTFENLQVGSGVCRRAGCFENLPKEKLTKVTAFLKQGVARSSQKKC